MGKVVILSEKPVLTTKFYTVKELAAQLPDGSIEPYHLIDGKPVVYVLPMTETGDIYVVRQYRYLFEKYLLEVIAGFIDDGEEPLTAAKRELEEETGITANIWKKISTTEYSSGTVKRKVYYFLAKDLTFGKAIPEDTEEISLVKMPLQEAVEKVTSGELNIVPSMTGILLLYILLQQGKV